MPEGQNLHLQGQAGLDHADQERDQRTDNRLHDRGLPGRSEKRSSAAGSVMQIVEKIN
jgi:hypothetical protein